MDNNISSIIFYSVALKDFEELDFKNDALAGVRACYFKENFTTQQGDTIRHFEESKYNYCYTLELNKPMLWKVFKNRQLIQGTKYLPDDMYCICFYNNDELVTKKIYFNKEHIWTKTEYFNPEKGNECICSISPKVINGYFALLKTVYDTTGYVALPLYMVSEMPSYELCEAVAYSDNGMMYFTAEAPTNITIDETTKKGFSFTINDFNLAKNLNSTFDISNAEYLNESNGNPYDQKQESVNIYSNSADIKDEPEFYSSTDIQEDEITIDSEEKSIETEEIIADEQESEVVEIPENLELSKIPVVEEKEETIVEEVVAEEEKEEIIADVTQVEETSTEEPTLESVEATEDIQSEELTKTETLVVESTLTETDTEDEAQAEFIVSEKPESDKIIKDGNNTYNYYGSVDENGNRNGYGRTESAQGKTAYEGEYKDDMRNGFGSFYYKDGSINYIGDWKNNLREGRGVGFRSSDSQVHVGKWRENMPEDIGVRFDKEGNFISLNKYSMGNKDGIGITFDSNGNLIVSKWRNNTEIDSTIIILNDNK